jgi:hypothetical protein
MRRVRISRRNKVWMIMTDARDSFRRFRFVDRRTDCAVERKDREKLSKLKTLIE